MATAAPAPVVRDALVAVRGELAAVAAFSFAANLLMLVPTVYLLQVFDRVLVSRSELTLLAVSMVALSLGPMDPNQ